MTLPSLSFGLPDDLYNELLFLVSSPNVFLVLARTPFTPLYTNYFIYVSHCRFVAYRALSSRSLPHGESPFHFSFRTSLDGPVS